MSGSAWAWWLGAWRSLMVAVSGAKERGDVATWRKMHDALSELYGLHDAVQR